MKKLPTTKQKTYVVKKIFGPTIQGEGSLCGWQTYFLRFAGCNQWNGKPEDKAESACPFCDTDFFGGDKMTAEEIVGHLIALRGPGVHSMGTMVTVSGGEPLLQFDDELGTALSRSGFVIAIETNGTVPYKKKAYRHVYNTTCSPKVPRSEMKLEDQYIDEMKVLYPHPNPEIRPEDFDKFNGVKYLQPVNDVDDIDEKSLKKCLKKLKTLPQWRLSLQLHKIIGVE